MWTTEQTLINNYGPIGEVLIKKDDGTFGFQTPPNGLTLAEYQLHNTLGVYFVLYKEDFGTKFEMSTEDTTKKASYDLYYDILNKDIWPRPYLAPDLVTRASELRTDIFNTVGQMKAMWVTGQSDIDADWDTYLNNLKKMGIDEFVSLYQQAYDSYAAAFK